MKALASAVIIANTSILHVCKKKEVFSTKADPPLVHLKKPSRQEKQGEKTHLNR
jgi:hypothetical protein